MSPAAAQSVGPARGGGIIVDHFSRTYPNPGGFVISDDIVIKTSVSPDEITAGRALTTVTVSSDHEITVSYTDENHDPCNQNSSDESPPREITSWHLYKLPPGYPEAQPFTVPAEGIMGEENGTETVKQEYGCNGPDESYQRRQQTDTFSIPASATKDLKGCYEIGITGTPTDTQDGTIASFEVNAPNDECETTLSIMKILDPPNDPGRFDLWIDDGIRRVAAGHTDSTGTITLPPLGLFAGDHHTVSETASTGSPTVISDYKPDITCVDTDAGLAVIASGQDTTTVDLRIPDGHDVQCVVRNVRKNKNCKQKMLVTFAVYGPMPKPAVHKCWTAERPGKNGGNWQGRPWQYCTFKGPGLPPRPNGRRWKPRSTKKPGFWFFEDTAGFLNDPVLRNALRKCARFAAAHAGAGQARFRRTRGYLYSAYRKQFRGSKYLPSRRERRAIKRIFGGNAKILFQLYDGPDFGCPSFQQNCRDGRFYRPIYSKQLYDRWKRKPGGMIGKIDVSHASLSLVEEKVLQLCRDSRNLKQMALYAASSTGGLRGARYDAVERALNTCTGERPN